MNTINHPDFVQPVSYSITSLPEYSVDAQVAATVDLMRQYAVDDSRSAPVRALSNQLLTACNCADDYVARVFSEAQARMYFQRDERTALPIDQDVVEVLIRPADTVVLSESQIVPGDCDCFSMLVASLLQAGGVPCSFVTISASDSDPKAFSHVYVVAYPDTEYRTVLDASHGEVVGWEAPNKGRYQEWPLVDRSAASSATVLGFLLVIGGLFMAYINSNSDNRMEMAA